MSCPQSDSAEGGAAAAAAGEGDAAAAGDAAAEDGEYLQSSWTMYFHDPDDRNWTLDSYSRVCAISTAAEFWGLNRRLAENNAIGKGMWFFMREDVFPCWDDKANIDGGCISFMVPKAEMARTWAELCEAMLCERLRLDGGEDCEEINGLTVSPKNDFCILKVWLRTEAICSADKLRVGKRAGIFVSNRAKIANEKPAPAPAPTQAAGRGPA